MCRDQIKDLTNNPNPEVSLSSLFPSLFPSLFMSSSPSSWSFIAPYVSLQQRPSMNRKIPAVSL